MVILTEVQTEKLLPKSSNRKVIAKDRSSVFKIKWQVTRQIVCLYIYVCVCVCVCVCVEDCLVSVLIRSGGYAFRCVNFIYVSV